MKRFNEVVVEFDSDIEFEEFKNNYIKNINFDEVKECGEAYNYVGNTEREIKNNQIEIGLGIYIKRKYDDYKNSK